jgi:hypothetical protein
MHDDPHINADGSCDCECELCYDAVDDCCICPHCDPDVCDIHTDVLP